MPRKGKKKVGRRHKSKTEERRQEAYGAERKKRRLAELVDTVSYLEEVKESNTQYCEQLRDDASQLEDVIKRRTKVIQELKSVHRRMVSEITPSSSSSTVAELKKTSPDEMTRSTFYRRVNSVTDQLTVANGGVEGRNNYIVHASQQLPHQNRVVSMPVNV